MVLLCGLSWKLLSRGGNSLLPAANTIIFGYKMCFEALVSGAGVSLGCCSPKNKAFCGIFQTNKFYLESALMDWKWATVDKLSHQMKRVNFQGAVTLSGCFSIKPVILATESAFHSRA